MTKPPPPRTATIDGVDVVILDPETYQQLDAYRRQIGARTAQLHSLRQRLGQAAKLFDQIEEVAATHPTSGALREILDKRHGILNDR